MKKYARYPFSDEARDYIAKHGPDIQELLEDIAYQSARYRGKERVLQAIEKGVVEPFQGTSKMDCLVEMLSYAVARMLVSVLKENFLLKRYALAEGVKLKNELGSHEDESPFVYRTLGMDPLVEDGVYYLHFTTYMKLEIPMRAKEWKLSNAPLANGTVSLTKVKMDRLAQSALQKKIEMELPLPIADNVTERLENDLAQVKEQFAVLKKQLPDTDLGRINLAHFPPCMKRLVGMAQRGENISHSGRFALTTFLHAIGASNEEILKVFAGSPDFDESIAMYQIEHITGVTSGTEYSPPECATMKSQGICEDPDKLCSYDWMTHPMKYYRAKDRGRKKKDGKKEKKNKGGSIKETKME